MKTLKGTNKQQQPDSGIHDTSAHCPRVYHVSLSTCVPSFNLLGLTFPEKSVTKTFNVWKLERKKNGEIKGQMSSSSLFPESCPLSTCVPSFNLLGLTVPEKSVKKHCLLDTPAKYWSTSLKNVWSKTKEERWRHRFPNLSQWALSVAMEIRVLIQCVTKPYAACPST